MDCVIMDQSDPSRPPQSSSPLIQPYSLLEYIQNSAGAARPWRTAHAEVITLSPVTDEKNGIETRQPTSTFLTMISRECGASHSGCLTAIGQ